MTALAHILRKVQAAYGRNLGVAMPGIVRSYDSASKTATIRPGVLKRVPLEEDPDEDGLETIPDLQAVPVVWPRGGNFDMRGSLREGDTVLLVCLDRDIASWRRSGDVSVPEDARLHDWSSAVAIPGLLPDSDPYGEPDDSAVLASRLDALISGLRSISIGPLAPIANMLQTMFPNIPAATPALVTNRTTTGSSVCLLDE